MNTLYTFGYAKATVDDLQKLVQDKDWWLVDVRMNPRSRQAQWNMKALQGRIGENYLHVPAFGNKNYKSGGEIELADPDEGLRVVSELLASKPVILMCACATVQNCHRRVAAEYVVARREVELIHLDPANVKKLLTPEVEPASELDNSGISIDVQFGLPGIGEDKIVRVVPPEQPPLL